MRNLLNAEQRDPEVPPLPQHVPPFVLEPAEDSSAVGPERLHADEIDVAAPAPG
ncbi:hypothetical protein [Brachybacterium sp. ACRRE]|uniref:hypothetical protein n=1 Tax=Brachybacterium sp. ACRRE TaxID=2918184 RepID=UPI001EF2B33A|nr:hypothetical protein [Brachybacterium sp. ACRRE]MCG7311073.1 hypothetical protein [Brachybacterium sp. ACRRE]